MIKFMGIALIWFGITCMLAGFAMVIITFMAAVSPVNWQPYFMAVFATAGVLSAIFLSTAEITINEEEI